MDLHERLLQERENWRRDRPFGYSARPVLTPSNTLNLQLWTCVVPGPEGSAFEGEALTLEVRFPNRYPAIPPGIKFLSRVHHPNVYADGAVCLDLLSTEWSPSLNIKAVLLSIEELLLLPNVDSPANKQAAREYALNKAQYFKRARLCLKRKQESRRQPPQN